MPVYAGGSGKGGPLPGKQEVPSPRQPFPALTC